MSQQQRHEADNTAIRTMTLIGGGLIVLLLATVATVGIALKLVYPSTSMLSADETAKAQSMTPGVVPNQAYDRQRYAAAEQRVLNDYEWLDDDHTLARIPIDRAIELLGERKLRIDWSPKSPHADSPAPVDQPDNSEEPL